MNIQSNVIKDAYKKDIVKRTFNEIYNTMKSVYGPYGTDIFIKNQGTYYTRDGKEVMASINFDNALSRDLLSILYQALEHQSRIAGDGTTSLVLLYINIYNELTEFISSNKVATSIFRREYDKIISRLCEAINNNTMKMTDELFKSMLFTCTQDPELSEKIYSNITDDLKGNAHIIINPSDYSDDFNVIRHTRPLIECTKMYSFFNMDDVFSVKNSRIIYCDGVLDIANIETIKSLLKIPLTMIDGVFSPTDIIILCDGITEATRNTLKKCRSEMFNSVKEDNNNIIIMRTQITSKEEKEDMSSFVYNNEELTGITHSITFESYIYQTIIDKIDEEKQWFIDNNKEIPAILLFDASQTNKDRLVYALTTPRDVSYDITKGMLIDSPLSEVSELRYRQLVNLITKEKSHVNRQKYTKRLKKIFGVFIEINIGSELMKDSQRKFELINDAIVSAQRGFNDGVLDHNSLVLAAYVLLHGKNNIISGEKYADNIVDIIYNSLMKTIECNYGKVMDEIVLDNLMNNSNLHDATVFKSDSGFIIENEIVEPFAIIENLLKNSTLAVDLALSEVFIVENFMQNYI